MGCGCQTCLKYVKMIWAIFKNWIWLWDWIFCMCETSIEATDWFIQTIGWWCCGYYYCTTSFNWAWTQVLCRFKHCSRRVRDSRWWGFLTMVPAGNKAKCLLLVNHSTKTIHHHHHHTYIHTYIHTYEVSCSDISGIPKPGCSGLHKVFKMPHRLI